MSIDPRLPIGEFAAEMPGASAVFEALGVDYACTPEMSLEDAAHAEGVVPDLVIASLRRLKRGEHGDSWTNRTLSELTQHLARMHRHLVRHELGRIGTQLSDLCSSQEDVPSDLLALRANFTQLTETLLPHVLREEKEVFGAIDALEKRWQSGQPSAPAPGDLKAYLRQLAAEHEQIAARLRTMRALRERVIDRNGLPPRWSAVFGYLAALEAHIHESMFFENWILFPRAAALIEQAAETSPIRNG